MGSFLLLYPSSGPHTKTVFFWRGVGQARIVDIGDADVAGKADTTVP